MTKRVEKIVHSIECYLRVYKSKRGSFPPAITLSASDYSALLSEQKKIARKQLEGRGLSSSEIQKRVSEIKVEDFRGIPIKTQ